MNKLFLLVLFFVAIRVEAVEKLPNCLDKDRKPMAVNNEEVLRWKESSPNQFKDRALVVGRLVGVLLDRKSHLHLEIDIGKAGAPLARNEHIEIVYNKEFGTVDSFTTGSEVYACGDYITARQKAGNYQPSPMGAIIHWVHMSPDQKRHASGFLAIDGKLFGQESHQESN